LLKKGLTAFVAWWSVSYFWKPLVGGGSKIKLDWLHEFFKFLSQLTINIPKNWTNFLNNLIYAEPEKVLRW
jgi:hypothetical protein